MRMIKVFSMITILFIIGCGFKPIQMRGGPRAGLTLSTYDPADGLGTYTGTGGLAGLGMGTDFLGLIGLDMAYQYRSVVQKRELTTIRHIYKYDNLYFPLTLSLRGSMIPVVAPYFSFGLGINVQLDGLERVENISGGGGMDTDLGGGQTTAFAIVGLGAELKLLKLRIVPEFMANTLGRDPEDPEKTTDYHLSIGVYYAP